MCFVAIGFLSPSKHSGQGSVVFQGNAQEIWDTVVDIDNLSRRRDDFSAVRVLRSDAIGALEWDVLLNNGNSRTYRRSDFVARENFSIDLIKSDEGLTGNWKYRLVKLDDGRVRLTVREKSDTEGWYALSQSIFLGRNRNIRFELESIVEVVEGAK